MNIKDSRLRVEKINTRQSYPWMSSCSAVIVILYLLLKDLPQLWPSITTSDNVTIPDILFAQSFQLTVVLLFTLIMLFDLQRFMRSRKQIKQNTKRLKQELNDIWQSKKKLQQKAHTYSGHADKLKLFISDKLLEYIEYDEKFLHFKSIASEVRHNGVISYDIVKTALKIALNKEQTLADNTEQNAAEHEKNTEIYRHALDAMRYLWDLLDLSTADNIALHIANYLIECEEHYYQIMLNQEQGNKLYQEVPYQPDFSASIAAKHTLATFLEPRQENDTFLSDEGTQQHENKQFRITLETHKSLLGNENHLRLILENLLKNAQHFANKTPFKQKSDRISLQLTEGNGVVRYAIYNRGPHVSDEDKGQIFQLGYSTRRVKEHHGKGLGLFFVNEIVKGYEGRINVENINNEAETYSLRIALENGDVITKVIKTDTETVRPQVRESQQDQLHKSLQWQFKSPVISVEISSTSGTETHSFNNFNLTTITSLLDPGHPHRPFWSIEVQPKRGVNKTHNVQFTPLDINGVQFNITLPTADSRMEGDELSLEHDFDQEVEKLNENFKELDDF